MRRMKVRWRRAGEWAGREEIRGNEYRLVSQSILDRVTQGAC